MTRDEVIGAGVTPAVAEAVRTFLLTNIPRPPRMADPTALVNNEGAMNGWINAAHAIGSLAVPAPKEEQAELPMYSEPARK